MSPLGAPRSGMLGSRRTPEFVDATSSAVSAVNNHVVTKPAGLAAGDVMVAIMFGNSTATHTGPAGWVLERTDDAGGARSTVWTRMVDGSEGASFQWTYSVPTTAIGIIGAYRHANPADAVQVTAASAPTSSAGQPVAPTITPTGLPARLVTFHGKLASSAGASPQAGMVEREELASGGTHAILADMALASVAATGAITPSGFSASVVAWRAINIVLAG